MSFIKLGQDHQNAADAAYGFENEAVKFVESLESLFGNERWFSIGRTHLEQGYMALRKGITEKFKSNQPVAKVKDLND